MERLPAVILFLALIPAVAGNAHAYLDPGTGNYVLQVLIAAGLSALFSIKMYFKEIKNALRNLFKKENREK